MAKLPGKPFNPVAGEINSEVEHMHKLAGGDKNSGLKPVETVRTKSAKRIHLAKRKRN